MKSYEIRPTPSTVKKPDQSWTDDDDRRTIIT